MGRPGTKRPKAELLSAGPQFVYFARRKFARLPVANLPVCPSQICPSQNGVETTKSTSFFAINRSAIGSIFEVHEPKYEALSLLFL
jgi:hypothetical protein